MSENSKARGGAGMSRAPQIVRARLKREGLPDWFICCPGMQKRADITANEILTVDPGSVFSAEVECPDCGRIIQDVKYMETVGKRRTSIAVDAYDLDEGPVTQ